MRIAVTGRNGQLARALQEASTDVIAIGRPELDLAHPASVLPALRAARPNAIVNAAAYTAVDQAESEPTQAFAINETGARAVAAAAAELGVPLLHVSTDFVFDGAKAAPYVETDTPAPLSVYGASKLAGERAVAAAHGDHATIRIGWLYSPHGINFVRTMLRLAESREEIAIITNRFGGPTYAADVAETLLAMSRAMIARDDPALRGVFHVAPPDSASRAELAEAIFALSRERGGPFARVRPIPAEEFPEPAPRPAQSRLDSSKIASAFGVRLPPWRASLASCLDRMLRPVQSPAS